MKPTKLLMIAVAVALLVVAVMMSKKEEKAVTEPFMAHKLFDAIDVDKVAGVQIADAASSVTLTKISDEKWGVAQRNDYPADSEKLRRTVLSVLSLTADDRLTADAEKYDRMGVGEKPESGRVTLMDKDGQALADVYLGKTRQGKSPEGGFAPSTGQFFRTGGDSQVYVAKDTLYLDKQISQWLSRDVIKVEAAGLRQIRIEQKATTESVLLSRTGQMPFELTTPLPEGTKLKSGALSSVESALANLSLSDVMSADDPRAEKIDYTASYEAVAKNGLTYVAKAGQLDGKCYVSLSALYNKDMDFGLSDEVTSDTQAAQAMEPAQAQAEKINAQHGPWIYELPQYTWDNLAKKLSGLVEPIKKEGEDAAPEGMPSMPPMGGMPPGGMPAMGGMPPMGS